MGRALTVLVVLIIATSGFFYLQKRQNSLFSPIPKVFGIPKSPQVNKWFPKEDYFLFDKKDSSLIISAQSALIVDYETANIIFQKQKNTRLPVASTVKIMTALVALENAKLKDAFSVSEKAASIGENSMGLTSGEKLTLEELLYGLMLVSGNDAAVTIAEGVAKTEENFVKMMNDTAVSLGLKNTKFINASGLDDDNNAQYSTAYDLAVIAHYIWEQYPEFRDITATINKPIEATKDHKAFNLNNETNLLTTYPGVRGIKPGFTWEAKLCLVTYAENSNKKLLAVILGSDDRRGEMKELLDYGFSRYGIKIEHPVLDM